MSKHCRIRLCLALMVLFCGCVQSAHNLSAPADDALPSPETRISAPGQPDATDSENRSTLQQAAIPRAEGTLVQRSAAKPTKIFVPDSASPKTGMIKDPIPRASKPALTNARKLPEPPKNTQQVLDEALDFCQVSQELWQKGELENALEALDQAYFLILHIDSNDETRLTQQVEDLRFTIAKRILEIYASRNIVVNGNHDAIPLVINSYVQEEIDRFTGKPEQGFFHRSYARSGRYRDIILPRLREAGLPEELFWLPLIESGFRTNALSKARALGLWQFIPSTGYKFGLKRDTFVDERLDPVKSTDAAIAYLNELHQIFGDWTTVLAAYNCGEGRVLNVIRSQNVNYLDDFWDLYKRLPRETARYVPRFLATLHIINNSTKYGLGAIPLDPPLSYETVTISRQVHLRDVAGAIGQSEKILKELNPELRYDITPRGGYDLRVPPGEGEMLLAKLDAIPPASRPGPTVAYHQIRRGETLSTIAGRYGSSVQRIAQANNIRNTRNIIAGTRLKIPLGGSVRYAEAQKKPEAAAPVVLKSSTHVVKGGENLWIIAKKYGTTTREIQQLNNLSSTRLHIGQTLKIAAGEAETPASNALRTYPVKRGDTPFKIAQQHNMALEHFLRVNRLTPRSKIYPGQELYVE